MIRPSQNDLTQIQRWMQSVITHPGGVVQGMQAATARAHLDVGPEAVEAVISPSKRQTSIERLQVYASAYYARLLECLRAEFPMMVKAVGDELFDEFAVAYLQQYPSQSYTLDPLGAKFPQFLIETRPHSDDEDNSWLDFLADLARLEWSISEVFDGPGVEGLALLDRNQLLAIPRARWPEARLVAVPCLRILPLDFPVHEYYHALRDGQEAAPPDRKKTLLAITRRNYVVRHLPLSTDEADVLMTLLEGHPVAEAVARINLPFHADINRISAELQNWFRVWSAEGFFLRAELDGVPIL